MINNILIIGGSGYLGSEIAKKIADNNNYNVTIGDLYRTMKNINFIKLNLLDKQEVKNSVKNFDLIINTTGQITKPINTCFNLNTIGIENLVQAAKKFRKKIIHISTVAVYGTCNYADEFTPLNPETSYATCKAFAEYNIKKLPKNKYCILRLTNLYGGIQKKGLLSYLFNSFFSNRELYFNNDGSLTRYFIHIDDAVESILLAIKYDLSGIYNVPAYDKFSIKEIIEVIETYTGVRFKTSFENIIPLENINKINSNKFCLSTNFTPQIKLKDFIKKTFISYE